jgi:hypothetical protein
LDSLSFPFRRSSRRRPTRSFITCDADALKALVADDFEFFHDKFGKLASTGSQFVENVRQGCEAQARGTSPASFAKPVAS